MASRAPIDVDEVRPDAPRRAAWVGPAVAAGCGVVALAYVAVSDPVHHQTLVPPCPFHAATGLWCPGCGLTRATNAILRGHVVTGLGYNLFTPLVFVLIGWSWLAWTGGTLGRPTPGPGIVPKQVWVGLIAALAVFTVARNLPVTPLRALAP
jgi:hypothetical protein